VIHNDYVLLPPGLQAALMKALLNGANVRIITNSATSSNHGAVNVAADAQYLALLRLGEDVRKLRKATTPPLRIWLYETSETLHTKIGLIGDHMIVGSTNADPRSTILDTQNGLLIGPGPNGNPVADQYRAWLETLLARRRDGKPVLSERTLASALEGNPKPEDVLKDPAKFTPDQQVFAYATTAFQNAMDWRTDHARRILYGGFLNTVLLNL
jgi:phosphatidylserine/phosphatidylglycerophosphate/cardiolipin synthase-like enzyme